MKSRKRRWTVHYIPLTREETDQVERSNYVYARAIVYKLDRFFNAVLTRAIIPISPVVSFERKPVRDQ